MDPALRERLEQMLAQREAEREAQKARNEEEDPLTFYTAEPIENYYDERLDKTYRLGPGPKQLECMLDLSTWRMLEGGNRCLAPSQVIYDPVADAYRTVSEIDDDFHVVACSEGHELLFADAGKPFVKDRMQTFRVTWTDGDSIECSLSHRVLCTGGEYLSIAQVLSDGRGVLSSRSLQEGRERRLVKIANVKPLGIQDVWDFHVPIHNNYSAGGVINHNSGKTMHALCECASYARNRHPVRKWSIPPNILILITTKRQAKQVWQDRLLERSKLLGPGEKFPLIPEWEIGDKARGKDIEYTYSGSERIATKITLKNGARIYFYWAGAAQAWHNIEGVDFDAVFRDESNADGQVGAEQLMPEIMARLLDAQSHPIKQKEHAGFMLWVCTDTKGSTELSEFRKRAQSDDGDWAHFKLTARDNPLIGAKDRERAAKNMGEDDAAVRIYGDAGYDDRFRFLRRHFDEDKHVYKQSYFPRDDDNLWVFIDPAFGRTGSNHGILLAAFGSDRRDQYRILAEDWKRNHSVKQQVDVIAAMMKSVNRCVLEGVVMDPAASKVESTGESVYLQYVKALREAGIELKRGRVLLGRNRKDDVYPMLITAFSNDRVLINPECKALIQQIYECRTRDPTKYSGPKGVVDKKLDVLMALLYGVSRKLAWVDRGPQPLKPPERNTTFDPSLGFDVKPGLPAHMQNHVDHLRQSVLIANRFKKKDREGWIQTARWG